MIGFVLAISSSFLTEVSDIIAKKKIQAHQVSVYTTAFLTSIFGLLILIISGFARNSFYFSYDSLPTLSIRIILEIILVWITTVALAKSNRSTFSFVRTLTIPLLLITDIVLGYALSMPQIVGVVVITTAVALFLWSSGKMEKRGLTLLLLSSVMPVATLSLYKYDISNFNSVESEQIVLSSVLLVFFFCMAVFKARENPFKFLLKPIFLFQSVTIGFAGVVGSFAYAFLSPSVVIAVLRSSAVLFATFSGNMYFHEKKFLAKLLICAALILGIIFLANS